MLSRRFWDDKRPPALFLGPGQREEGAVGIVRVEGVEGSARAEGVGGGVGREGTAQLPRLVGGARGAEWRRLRAVWVVRRRGSERQSSSEGTRAAAHGRDRRDRRGGGTRRHEGVALGRIRVRHARRPEGVALGGVRI